VSVLARWWGDGLLTSVIYRIGIFRSVSVGISWYLPYRYRRKYRSVHFGIIFLAGTPFSLKKGELAPFLRKRGHRPPFCKFGKDVANKIKYSKMEMTATQSEGTAFGLKEEMES
jgi:hypothetical protein